METRRVDLKTFLIIIARAVQEVIYMYPSMSGIDYPRFTFRVI